MCGHIVLNPFVSEREKIYRAVDRNIVCHSYTTKGTVVYSPPKDGGHNLIVSFYDGM